MNPLYDSFLKKGELKNTEQRKILFEITTKQKTHFSVDEILLLAKKSFPTIGIATVYRFLHTMVKCEILEEHQFGEKKVYEPRDDASHHDHIICEKCGHIEEFSNEEIENIQVEIAQEKEFYITSHKHELYGVCKACSSKAE